MTAYQVRRANIDDLPQLIALWEAVQLPAVQLEKRLTEFQVIEENGKLLGAVGIQIHQHDGFLHSETFADFGLADRLRPRLWERLERVVTNHGLYRVWTQETAPFWKQVGFRSATKEELQQRPVPFSNNEKFEWYLVQLKDPAAAQINLDKEFERFKESERAKTEEMMSQAKIIKVVATIIAVGLFSFSMYFLYRIVFKPSGHTVSPSANKINTTNPTNGAARPGATNRN